MALWRAMRAELHAEVCAKGWNADRGAFTQSYGSPRMDASTSAAGVKPAMSDRGASRTSA